MSKNHKSKGILRSIKIDDFSSLQSSIEEDDELMKLTYGREQQK
ncbi:hypothetical protein [Paraglaciecola chathamensis]|nr:hypothetical protein [Paraglaciecola chathamensis]